MERTAAALWFQPVDRTPVHAQVFGHAASLSGAALGDYVCDGETLASCQLTALKRYGYDAVFAVMDVNVETEACGSKLKYSSSGYPTVERYAFELAKEFNWVLPDPHISGRMPQVLRALGIMRGELGNSVPVVGCVLGPFTLVSQLVGLEQTLFMAVDQPDLFERLMDYSVEVIVAFGRAQLEAGAHLPLVFDPSASPAVVPPSFFREFELPRLKRVFGSLAAAGSIANWLHIAGPVQSILPYFPEAGVTLANFDYCVHPAEAGQMLSQTCLDGNVKSLSFIDASPGEIEAEATALLEYFRTRRGFILSSGCEIPPEACPENIDAMIEAARRAGAR